MQQVGTVTPETEEFPRELLLTEERLLLEVKPSFIPYILLPITSFATLFVLGALYATFIASISTTAALLLCGTASMILLVIVAVATVVSYMRWKGTFYAVTDRRIIASSGVLGRTVMEAPLGNVQNVSLHQSWFQKAVGYGTISFATSGVGAGVAALQKGPTPWAISMGAPSLYGDIVFFGVKEPMVVRRRIDEIVERSEEALKKKDYRAMAEAFKEESAATTPTVAVTRAPTKERVVPVRVPREALRRSPAKFCEFCGSRLAGQQRFCETCGRPVA